MLNTEVASPTHTDSHAAPRENGTDNAARPQEHTAAQAWQRRAVSLWS